MRPPASSQCSGTPPYEEAHWAAIDFDMEEKAGPNYYDLVHSVPDWQPCSFLQTLCHFMLKELVLSPQLHCKSFDPKASVLEVPATQLVARRPDLSLPQISLNID